MGTWLRLGEHETFRGSGCAQYVPTLGRSHGVEGRADKRNLRDPSKAQTPGSKVIKGPHSAGNLNFIRSGREDFEQVNVRS